MITISLCMIVKNEEDMLDFCLSGAGEYADEIILVDTGSVDGTKKAARKYTDKIYDFKWRDDFSAARNFALEKASMEYCMWLDADDQIQPEERKKLVQLKHTLPKNTDVVMLRYAAAFDEWGRPSFSYYRERLLRRCPLCRFRGRVHEAIVPFGNIRYEDICVEHRKTKPADSDRNLNIYRSMEAEGWKFEPRETYYYARELLDHGDPSAAAGKLTEFLEMPDGWEEDKKEACRLLSFCLSQAGEERSSLHMLLRALEYGPPSPELCCDIGKWFFDRQQWRTAACWYEQALSAEPPKYGFSLEACRGYLPCVQLCVCWWHLGDAKKSLAYHRESGRWNPSGAEYLKNVAFFEGSAYGK